MSEKSTVFRSLRNAFITGLLILAPLGASIIALAWLVDNVGGRFSKNLLYFIPEVWLEAQHLSIVWNLLATLIVFTIIALLGYLSRYFVGKWILAVTERILTKVPFIKTIYKTVKQIIDTFSTQQKAVFKKTVLVQYPRKGVWAIGFLTSDTKGELQQRSKEDLRNIFLPTTPNPTSGFLLMLPKDDIEELEMSIGEGMKLIISGGAVVPPFQEGTAAPDPVQIENPREVAGAQG